MPCDLGLATGAVRRGCLLHPLRSGWLRHGKAALRVPTRKGWTRRDAVLLCSRWAGRKALVHPLGGDIPRLIAFRGCCCASSASS